MRSAIYALVFLSLLISSRMFAQDTTDLMKQLENEGTKPETNYVTSSFKTTRVVNGHSIENTKAGVLDLRINHRFSELKSGVYELFGLDNASMRLGFDYGITNNIMVGVGHSTLQKTYDLFFKIKLLRQSTGKHNMPVTVSFVPTFTQNTLKNPTKDSGVTVGFGKRGAFVGQLLIGRKFSEGFSMQIMPTFIHEDYINSHADNISYPRTTENIAAIGIGARQKISRRVTLNGEYYYQFPGTQSSYTANVLSVGFDIETGGHVFQLHFTNSRGMTEKAFIAETNGKWGKGNISFGFNISRVFHVKKHTNSKW